MLRRVRLLAPLTLLMCVWCIPAAIAEWAPGVPVDTPFPGINASDQTGQAWTNKELIGKKGLVFLFNRSSDW